MGREEFRGGIQKGENSISVPWKHPPLHKERIPKRGRHWLTFYFRKAPAPKRSSFVTQTHAKWRNPHFEKEELVPWTREERWKLHLQLILRWWQGIWDWPHRMWNPMKTWRLAHCRSTGHVLRQYHRHGETWRHEQLWTTSCWRERNSNNCYEIVLWFWVTQILESHLVRKECLLYSWRMKNKSDQLIKRKVPQINGSVLR